MSQTKILIIAGTMDVGGIENQLMHLIRNADRGKFQIDFTTTMSHPFYQDEYRGIGRKMHPHSGNGGSAFHSPMQSTL